MSMFNRTGSVIAHSPDRAGEMPQPGSETAAQEAAHRTFEEQSSEFYWLAYLLTGDSERAVQAFTGALEFSDAPTPVFREFMISWARKLVIASALATVALKLRASALSFEQSDFDDMARHARSSSSLGMMSRDLTKPELHCALLAIDVFPRCALLLTIFEKLSVKDAALLLNADERLVRRAQASALIDLSHNLARAADVAERTASGSQNVHKRA